MEERLVAQAGAAAVPRLTSAAAARTLGADPAQLEDTLTGHAQQTQPNHPERTGLTPDQAAAALSVLTDGHRVSVINAPAGSGKTARVPEYYNIAQFLGHLPDQRDARGSIDISEGTLLLVDESSMIPTPDLAALVNLAEARNPKMILAGDTEQLQAVENGGALSLLADALGYRNGA